MNSVAIFWAQYGPYHLARVAGLRRAAPANTSVHAIELSDQTQVYLWRRENNCQPLHTLVRGAATEDLGFRTVFWRTRAKLAELGAEVCLLPGYWPKQSLAALLAAKSLGLRTVMMNESHVGTGRSSGLVAQFKRTLVGLFDAALVGGVPQRNYFASLGMPEARIFTGYDAVDNEYFGRLTEEHRLNATRLRHLYRLPVRYILSLGRFVAKKNLRALISGYGQFLQASPLRNTHLVMVGSGPEEAGLKSLCRELRLPIYERENDGPQPLKNHAAPAGTENSPGVHFYGFRQVDQNPIFYALAETFVLPSRREEWGLVVNEAMASGLPVVVSQNAGCVEDLLEPPESQDRGDWNCLPPGLSSRLRRNGFVFDPESPGELAGILLLLESRPQQRAAMGQHSRRIVEKFSCENFGRNALAAAGTALVSPRGREQAGALAARKSNPGPAN